MLSSTFSNHNGIKPQINHKKKMRKTAKIGRLKNMLPENQWVEKGTKEKIQIPRDK